MKSLSLSAWSPCNSPKWQAALGLLLEAAYYNLDLNDHSHFSVATEDLQAAGLTQNDIHWLVAKGHIVLRSKEATASKRRPRAGNSAALRRASKRTRVMLTEQGIAFACAICNANAPVSIDSSHSADQDLATTPPRWDHANRTLWLGSCVVKRFKVPAANQELILNAFTEEGWPHCIDDPLPVTKGIDAKDRLHDTIKRLNGGHECQLIRFHGNGNGLAVHWKSISLSA